MERLASLQQRQKTPLLQEPAPSALHDAVLMASARGVGLRFGRPRGLPETPPESVRSLAVSRSRFRN